MTQETKDKCRDMLDAALQLAAKWQNLLDAAEQVAAAEVVRDDDVDEDRVKVTMSDVPLEIGPDDYGECLREAMFHRLVALAFALEPSAALIVAMPEAA